MYGLIYKYDDDKDIYLCFFDNKERFLVTDSTGILGTGYENLTLNDICFCEVEIKDGTKDIEIEDPRDLLEELKNSSEYKYFFHIRQRIIYNYPITIKQIIDDKNFLYVANKIYDKQIKNLI